MKPLERAEPDSQLRHTDLVLLAVFSFALFAYASFFGPALSLHEARLPQLAREMLQNHDWLIPRSGGRPWLERPPLPHWMTIAVSAALGQHCDKLWVVRLPAALAGCLVTLMTAWIAARLFGRWTGICSGLVLATSYEFYKYSCLAEDDIFLAIVVVAAIALFVSLEFPAGEPDKRVSFFGSRTWQLPAMFALIGLTNFAKGPLVGAAVVGMTVVAFVFSTGQLPRIRRYIWSWGWLICIALTVAWPALVYLYFKTEAINNWKFDYAGTSEFDNPFWYYPVNLLWTLAPWTPAIILGLCLTARTARAVATSPERFLWCWAILPIAVLSLPHRKHHHYLVPNLAPWAILGAISLRHIARSMFAGPLWSRRPTFGLLVFGLPGVIAILIFRHKIPGPAAVTYALLIAWLLCIVAFYHGLETQRAGLVLGTLIAGLAAAFCWGTSVFPDPMRPDTQFLQRTNIAVPAKAPLFIDADLHGELDFFRNQFYVRTDAILLHNLTYLRDDKLTASVVYVITREWNAAKLGSLGNVEIVDQSTKSRPSSHAKKAKLKSDRFTLYRLTFRTNLLRYPAPSPHHDDAGHGSRARTVLWSRI